LEQLLIGVLIFVGIIISAFIEVAKENRQERLNPKKTLSPEEIELRRQKEEEMKQQVRSKHAEALRKSKDEAARKVRENRRAVLCPNCGAPLKTIYTECEYCEMSYKEASDLRKDTLGQEKKGE
jgi:hypothetical protein